jgi:hypothetical protein
LTPRRCLRPSGLCGRLIASCRDNTASRDAGSRLAACRRNGLRHAAGSPPARRRRPGRRYSFQRTLMVKRLVQNQTRRSRGQKILRLAAPQSYLRRTGWPCHISCLGAIASPRRGSDRQEFPLRQRGTGSGAPATQAIGVSRWKGSLPARPNRSAEIPNPYHISRSVVQHSQNHEANEKLSMASILGERELVLAMPRNQGVQAAPVFQVCVMIAAMTCLRARKGLAK